MLSLIHFTIILSPCVCAFADPWAALVVLIAAMCTCTSGATYIDMVGIPGHSAVPAHLRSKLGASRRCELAPEPDCEKGSLAVGKFTSGTAFAAKRLEHGGHVRL